MIAYKQTNRNKNPRKTSISDLFLPSSMTFDDYRAEWNRLRERESADPSHAPGIARARTAILDVFPSWELPSIIDRLNSKAEEVAP